MGTESQNSYLMPERMEATQMLLVIIDISGYTTFMKRHVGRLVHAERIVLNLLHTIATVASGPLVLHELTGDAVSFHAYCHDETSADKILPRVRQSLLAARRRWDKMKHIGCEVCATSTLEAKAVLHYGTVVLSHCSGRIKIAGPDVILAHRLLKNSVVEDSYVLMTAEFYDMLETFSFSHARWQLEHCSGFGDNAVLVWYPDREDRHATTSRSRSGSRKRRGRPFARTHSLSASSRSVSASS